MVVAEKLPGLKFLQRLYSGDLCRAGLFVFLPGGLLLETWLFYEVGDISVKLLIEKNFESCKFFSPIVLRLIFFKVILFF